MPIYTTGTWTWYQANDDLAGTAVYGDPSDDSVHWSIAYSQDYFSQFGFAYLDFSIFIILDKSQVFDIAGGINMQFLRSTLNSA